MVWMAFDCCEMVFHDVTNSTHVMKLDTCVSLQGLTYCCNMVRKSLFCKRLQVVEREGVGGWSWEEEVGE